MLDSSFMKKKYYNAKAQICKGWGKAIPSQQKSSNFIFFLVQTILVQEIE